MLYKSLTLTLLYPKSLQCVQRRGNYRLGYWCYVVAEVSIPGRRPATAAVSGLRFSPSTYPAPIPVGRKADGNIKTLDITPWGG